MIRKMAVKSFVSQIRKELKISGKINKLVENILDEMQRNEEIKNRLFVIIQEEEVTQEYTNKAGAKNTVVNPAIKEYKAYVNSFKELVKTLDGLTGNNKITGKVEADEFEKLLQGK